MTPEEKAKELILKHHVFLVNHGKHHALITVTEILNEFPKGVIGSFEEKRKQYWQSVLLELNKSK